MSHLQVTWAVPYVARHKVFVMICGKVVCWSAKQGSPLLFLGCVVRAMGCFMIAARDLHYPLLNSQRAESCCVLFSLGRKYCLVFTVV